MKLNLKEYTDTLRTISLEILVLCAQVIFKLSFIYLFIICFVSLTTCFGLHLEQSLIEH